MPQPGNNLPGFREVQLEFAAHIRNPDVNARPRGVQARRMQIYLDLFYNNIESFLKNGFPVAREVLGDTLWHSLVRDFVHRHGSASPYFLEITQEFLTFLGDEPRGDVPEFLLELCHYEWVELALSVAEEEIPNEGIDVDGDLLERNVVLSPLIWPLTYRYPVHQIGPAHRPSEAPAEPTHLVVYRRRDDKVKFLLANALTLRLIEVLEARITGREALARLIAELADAGTSLDSQVVHDQGLATMERLRDSEIILGTETEPGAER